MGRTRRRRKLKRTNCFETCNYSSDLNMLNSWLSKSGIQRSKKLVLTIFSDCNRGVLTKKRIRAGDELLSLPLNLTINVTTLLMDEEFCAIFLDSNILSQMRYKQAISFQCLLAFYLLFLKVQGNSSKWYLYMQSLPKVYTVPYFLTNETKKFLDPNILCVIEKQQHIINSAYNLFHDLLNVAIIKNEYKNAYMFKSTFNKSDFEWAYFTVNTRCVFMDLTNLLNLTHMQHTILSIINDNTKISLCPFLDMINHSAYAKNETKLIVNKELNSLPVVHLKENLLSKVNFSIYTKTTFEAYSQVFICYGDSYNLKLVTEYGFYIASNNLDYVPIEYEQIVTFLNSINKKVSQDQYKCISKHGLDKDLYVDIKGMSFNLYGLLIVIKYFYRKDVDVSQLLYSAAICSYDRELFDLIKPILMKKLIDMEYNVCQLQKFDKCAALCNCIVLMCQCIKILKKFCKY
ncbi:SET domain-containing protein 4 [Pieris napi]|uniref:SET domain-containing protein 4 n=1 Tax=Pieris napi TaxID=78633 RepID=UPI001FBBEFCB|nr:SET domain-containing protein 4 [Pieris napi]